AFCHSPDAERDGHGPYARARAAELPSCTALGQRSVPGHESRKRPEDSAYVRSKIKVTTGELPSEAPPQATSSSAVSGTGSFECQVCQKTFQFQRMLNRHLKCHSDSKRHLCTYCGKGFNDTFDLKRHVRTHTGVRPYKCEMCEKAFTQRCSLESHMKKIHGVTQQFAYKERRSKLYVCEECGHTASTQDSLFRHLHAHHPNSAFLRAKGARKLGGAATPPGTSQGAAGEQSSLPGSPLSLSSDDATGSGSR
uniref:C2H2-type domain-containing protein n=1 Tax=Denticeps clupeoides TaxID=299321 RepID=A0AAY3ZTY4_9TELE